MRLRIGVIAAALLVITSAANAQYIKDITVVSGGSDGVACPSGYEKIGQDLNAGAGGDYIYACVMRTPNRSEALFDLYLVNNGNLKPEEGWSSSLSAEDGGGRKDFSRATLCEPNLYKLIGKDLNKGAGGSYIWFCEMVNVYNADTEPRLTDLKFNTSGTWISSDSGKCPWANYTVVQTFKYSHESSYDLNHAAGGKFIYACKRRG